MKRVTVFKADGQIKDCASSAVINVIETMEPGEYGYVWFRERWILKGEEDIGTEILRNDYSYILDSSVPEELKMKLVLLQ